MFARRRSARGRRWCGRGSTAATAGCRLPRRGCTSFSLVRIETRNGRSVANAQSSKAMSMNWPSALRAEHPVRKPAPRRSPPSGSPATTSTISSRIDARRPVGMARRVHDAGQRADRQARSRACRAEQAGRSEPPVISHTTLHGDRAFFTCSPRGIDVARGEHDVAAVNQPLDRGADRRPARSSTCPPCTCARCGKWASDSTAMTVPFKLERADRRTPRPRHDCRAPSRSRLAPGTWCRHGVSSDAVQAA